MTTRASVGSVAPWLGVALALLFALHDRFGRVDTRLLILAAVALAATGIARRYRDARTPAGRLPEARALRRRTFVACLLFGALTLATVVLRAIFEPRLGLRADVIASLVPPLIGWSIFLALPIGLAPATGDDEWAPRLPGSLATAAIAFAAIWIATLARTHFDSIDEVLYTLQAHRFALGQAAWALDPELQRFVKLPLMALTPDRIYTLYPPGYPAFLAPFVKVGVPSLAGAVLGALAALGVYRLGRAMGSQRVGLLAALLLASSPFVIRWSSAFLSHAAGMTALCIAAWLAVDASDRADRRGDVAGLLAGLLIGVAITIRPVTGIAVGLSIWLALATRPVVRSRLWRVTALLCIGGVLPMAAFLAYNAATTGNALQLGYQATLGHLNDPGFGTRGIILYDRDVRPTVSAFHFGVGEAVRNEVTFAFWPLARDLFPVWWLVPLVAVAVVYGYRVRATLVAAFLVLPIVNFVFFGNGERLYVELVPFVLVVAALLVRHVGATDGPAARALAVFLVGANIAVTATNVAADYRQRARRPNDGERISRALRDSSRSQPNILVFVRNPPLAEPLLIGLTPFNFGRFPGPVVVARDLGAENARLACRLPGYRVLVAESSDSTHEARLFSLRDSSLASPRCDRPALVPTAKPSA